MAVFGWLAEFAPADGDIVGMGFGFGEEGGESGVLGLDALAGILDHGHVARRIGGGGHVIQGVHQAEGAAVAAANLVLDVLAQALAGLLHLLGCLAAKLEFAAGADEGTIAHAILEFEGENVGAIRGFPGEEGGRGMLVGATPDDAVGHVEAPVDLGHLGGMAEHVAGVGHGHGLHAPFPRDPAAQQEIAHQRFGAGTEEIRHGEPGANEDAPVPDQLLQARALLGTNGEVVGQHTRLPVEVEVAELLVLLHQVEQAIDQLDEQQAELLEGTIPFAIPVGAGDVMGAMCDAGHGGLLVVVGCSTVGGLREGAREIDGTDSIDGHGQWAPWTGGRRLPAAPSIVHSCPCRPCCPLEPGRPHLRRCGGPVVCQPSAPDDPYSRCQGMVCQEAPAK